MSWLSFFGYVADVCILGSYGVMSFVPSKVRAFHWANAWGCVPLLIAEVQAGLWQVVVITGTFGVLGWLGVWRTRNGTT